MENISISGKEQDREDLEIHQNQPVHKENEIQSLSQKSSSPIFLYGKTLAGVTLGVLCVLTGYSILFYIQSSLHSKGGLGSLILTLEYSSQVVTGLFLPPFMMKIIGCKWSLVASSSCIAIFIVTNVKDSLAILVTAAIFLGLGSASLWATMNTIVSELAIGYAKVTGKSVKEVLSLFFSIFFSLINTAVIWANIISSLILSPPLNTSYISNSSMAYAICGAHHCDYMEEKPSQNFNSSDEIFVPQSEVNNLVIVGLACVGLGIVFLLFLLQSDNPKDKENMERPLTRLLATVRLLRNPDLLLLIPYTMSLGLMTSFLSADFNKAFVTCTMGIHSVGYVTTCYGATMAAGTVLLGFVAPYLPRVILFLTAVALNMADLLFMLFWIPDPNTPVMYVIAGIWGATFAVWLSQLCALYGEVFIDHHQEAFSNHRICDCIGFALGFSWSHYLCMKTKIYILVGFILIGTIGYLIVERRLAERNKKKSLEPTLERS